MIYLRVSDARARCYKIPFRHPMESSTILILIVDVHSILPSLVDFSELGGVMPKKGTELATPH